MVTRFMDDSPQVTGIVSRGAFRPFFIAERCADGSDKCTIGEGIESGSICTEHQAIKAIFKLFWREEILFEFMHIIPFSQDAGDTFVLAIILPVSSLLLFFDTAQTETMNGMFRLQTNDFIIEKAL